MPSLKLNSEGHQEFLFESKCALKENEKGFLKLFITGQTTLMYRASLHGYSANDFHSRSDNKGATISLLKLKDGPCIGGFTNANW